jgi:S-adenosyl methyltransferase
MTSDEASVPDDESAVSTAGSPAFDISVASQARMYDYLLGGKDNCAADRAAVEQALKVWPDMPFTARANRAFLGRAVRYLAEEAGIRQFLDIGTGIPTAGNTHEVAQAIAPESRVVYVDYDPVVLAHARALLNSSQAGATQYIDADLRDTATIVRRAGHLLDLTRPVAVTLMAILNAIPDSDDPYGIVAAIMDALPSGSYLALTHLASDLLGQEAQVGIDDVQGQLMRRAFTSTSRDREQVARFFERMDMVEPGLVRVEDWRPVLETSGPETSGPETSGLETSGPETSGLETSGLETTGAGRSSLWCAVGRKR